MSDHVKIGCEVYITKEDKILLGKRKNCYGEGTWGLPGGHLELGEKMVDAAKRELEEELGIKNPKLKLHTIADSFKGRDHYIHITFLLENFDGVIQLMEPDRCEEWKYFPIDNLPQPIFPGHIEMLETFKKHKLYLY